MGRRTALVLLAANADNVLHDLRVRYFRNLDRRMPAHVTVLFPFRTDVDDATLHTIAGVCAGLPPIDAAFNEIGRFRSDVVWLRPDPIDGFERASDAVLAAFPDCAPYRGVHAGRTLHLTVASRLRGREAERLSDELSPLLPIRERIEQLTLMAETGARWRDVQSWPLTSAP